MSIRISQLKDHFISVDQARNATSAVAKYLETSIIKENSKLYKTTFPHNIVFTKEDDSTSDEEVEVLYI